MIKQHYTGVLTACTSIQYISQSRLDVMSLTRVKLRLVSESPWHIVEGPNTLRHLLQAPGKSRMHGILLNIKLPIFVILEFDSKAIGVGSLIAPMVSEDNHGPCTTSACHRSNKRCHTVRRSDQLSRGEKQERKAKRKGSP